MNVFKTDSHEPNGLPEQSNSYADGSQKLIDNKAVKDDLGAKGESAQHKDHREKRVAVMKKEIANCDIPRMQASLSASVRAGNSTAVFT
jgi:hypothetical protein